MVDFGHHVLRVRVLADFIQIGLHLADQELSLMGLGYFYGPLKYVVSKAVLHQDQQAAVCSTEMEHR